MKTNTLRLSAVAALCAVLMAGACAADPADPGWHDKGFSYFIGLARQDLHYSESVRNHPIESDVSTSSPLLVSGALYAVNHEWMFGLENETTFAPSSDTETWSATGPVVNGVTLTSRLLQQNLFRLSESTTRLLAHYRWRDQLHIQGGFGMHSQSFDRYSLKSGPDQVTNVTAGLTEETVGEVLLQGGVALESEQIRGASKHYSLGLLVGLPVWRHVQNTATPDLTFNGTGGYDLSLEGRYSRAVLDNVHLGGWVKYGYSKRGWQSAGTAEQPESQTIRRAVGLELLWKL